MILKTIREEDNWDRRSETLHRIFLKPLALGGIMIAADSRRTRK
jgi:hypothetical protein